MRLVLLAGGMAVASAAIAWGCATDLENFEVAGSSSSAGPGGGRGGAGAGSAGSGGADASASVASGGGGASVGPGGAGGAGGGCKGEKVDCGQGCIDLNTDDNCGKCGLVCDDVASGFICHKTEKVCGCKDNPTCDNGASGTCKPDGLCECGGTTCEPGEQCISDEGSKCSCGSSDESCSTGFYCVGGSCLCGLGTDCQNGGVCDITSGHCLCQGSVCQNYGHCNDSGDCPGG